MMHPDIRSGDLIRIDTPQWEGLAIVADVEDTEHGQNIELIPDPSQDES